MRIAVWVTGHEIADTVGQAIYSALPTSTLLHVRKIELVKDYDVHIGYGILRGMENVFSEAERLKKPWFNVDRGYLKPSHYGGNYRVSLRGTQHTQRGLHKIHKEKDRFDALEIEVKAWKGLDATKSALVCPPTDYAIKFFKINLEDWMDDVKRQAYFMGFKKCIIRPKGTAHSLQDHFDKCGAVITFNSAVGWEALLQGIPVVSDPKVSFIGTNCREVSLDKLSQFQQNNRRAFFDAMSKLQMPLAEMKANLWPLMDRLMLLSDMTRESRHVHTSQPIAYVEERTIP